MGEERVQRRLAAILAADMVGYSRLMGSDEEGTFARLKMRYRKVIEPLVAYHNGRVFKTTGDGFLAEFGSVVDSVRCGVELQNGARQIDADEGAGPPMEFRIGIHVGDVISDGSDVIGDTVNIAARLQTLTGPGSIFISSDAEPYVRGKLDAELVDVGEFELKNISHSVRAYRVDPPSRREQNQGPQVHDGPSIALMPFENISRDPDQEYFADGMVEEIITALSRIRWLFVISRNSSFSYKQKSVDVKQIGRELGVRYLLQGSVRRSGIRIRISAQLIDAATGKHVWADRFEGENVDVFDLQDRISESVAGAIQPSILTAEIARSTRKRPENLAAYDFVLRALPIVWSLDRDDSEKAQRLLEQALTLDPSYPFALSLAAWCHAQRVVYNWTTEIEEEREQALTLAQRAASISQDDPLVLAILGAAHTIVRDFRTAQEHLERATKLDPNSALAWTRSAWLSLHQARGELAIQQFERALQLSPLDPTSFVIFFGIADAHFLEGRYEEAVEWSYRGLSQQPKALWQLRVLVPALVHAGRSEEARRLFASMIDHYPDLTVTRIRNVLPFAKEMMDRIAVGLHAVGLPD